MARKHKLRPDPALAHAHDAGTKVVPVTVLEHSPLGTISYLWPRYWVFHYQTAVAAYEALMSAQEELLHLPLNKNNMRILNDMAFLERVYRSGVEMVLNVVCTVQQLCEEIERNVGVVADDSTLPERLAAAAKAAALPRPAGAAGYEKFTEMIQVRDAVEHPKSWNVYSASPTDWDRVPLSWMLSDKGVRTYEAYEGWLHRVVDGWELRRVELAAATGPGTLTGVTRGIRSVAPAKKPPLK